MAIRDPLCISLYYIIVLGFAACLVAGQEPSVIGDAQDLLDLAWSKEDSQSAARVLGDYYAQGGDVASLAPIFDSEDSDNPEARNFVITTSIFEAVQSDSELVQFFADLFVALISDDESTAAAKLVVTAIQSRQGQPELFGQIYNLIAGSDGCVTIQDTIDSVQKEARNLGNIRTFLDQFVGTNEKLASCVKCFDEVPDDSQTCAERKLFGQCASDWLIDGYFCAQSCELCTASAKTAPEKAPAKKPAPKPAKTPPKKAVEEPEPVVEESVVEKEPEIVEKEVVEIDPPVVESVVEPVVEEVVPAPVSAVGLVQDRTSLNDLLPSPLPRPRLIDSADKDEEPAEEEPVPVEFPAPAPEPVAEPPLAIAMPEKKEAVAVPTEEEDPTTPVAARAVSDEVSPSLELPPIPTPVPASVVLQEPSPEMVPVRAPVATPEPVVEQEVAEAAPGGSLTVPLPRVQLEPTVESLIEPVPASQAITSRPALKLTPEEENEALTVAQTVSSGNLGIAVSLLTGLGKEGKSNSVAEGLALALEQSTLETVSEALGLVFQDPLAPEFFKDPLSTALFLGGKPIADAIAGGIVLATEQGEIDSAVAMLNVLIEQGGQVSSLMEDAITDVLDGGDCGIMKEALTQAQIVAEDEGLSTALESLLALQRIKCGADASAVPAPVPVPAAGPVPALVAADPVEAPVTEEAVPAAVPTVAPSPTVEEQKAAVETPAATTTTATTDVDSEAIQSLAESEAVLTASAVFVDAINGFETNPDVSGITGAFKASLVEGQETELLALILSVYQQLDDKDLLGRALGAVAAQGGPEVVQILAGGMAQVAIASGCEGVGLSLVQITNATTLEGEGEAWQEAVAAQGDALVQCLGVDVDECNNAAQDDCCTEAEGPVECHFCEFDIGCRYEKDASSIESLGLLIYKDRFFPQICKCPIASS